MSAKRQEDCSDENEESQTNEEKPSQEIVEKEKKSPKDQESSLEETQPEAKMHLNDAYISPERRSYNIMGNPASMSKAETFVTRSVVDKYGPIVSPTISPTKSLEKNGTKLISRSPTLSKTDRDYEAATLICSIGDTVRNMPRSMHELTSSSIDTLRVSRISTLIGFTPAAVQDYSNFASNRAKNSMAPRDKRKGGNDYEGAKSVNDNNSPSRGYCNGHAEKRDNYASPNTGTSDDSGDSEGENDDYSMIIRPRDPEHTHADNGHSSGYACRLPCCTRVGYLSQFSPESTPIRVPARRPAQFSNETHQNSDGDHEAMFPPHRDSSKSAFSTVSPTRKRSDPEFSYSTIPAIKVRVIKETKPPSDNRFADQTALKSHFEERYNNGDIETKPHFEERYKNEVETKPQLDDRYKIELRTKPHLDERYKNETDSNFDSKKALAVVHHYRDSVYTTIEIENDNQPQYHYKNSACETKSVETITERSYLSDALLNGVLANKKNVENSFSESQSKVSSLLLPKVSPSYKNGHFMSNYPSHYSGSSGYPFVKQEGSPTDSRGPLVQCSTVDSTAMPENCDGESRLLDLARVANEQLGEELARQQPVVKKGKPKSNDCLHLWEFLRDILNNDTTAPHAIEWTVRERGEFRLIKTGVVAQMWGMSKNRTSMTYEKMARAMRYYYKMKILEKVPHKRLHFRFGKHMLSKVLVSKN